MSRSLFILYLCGFNQRLFFCLVCIKSPVGESESVYDMHLGKGFGFFLGSPLLVRCVVFCYRGTLFLLPYGGLWVWDGWLHYGVLTIVGCFPLNIVK